MIKIGDTDITKYIVQGGISENSEKVYDDDTADDGYTARPCKGIYRRYSLSLEAVPMPVKASLSSCAGSAVPVSCIIGNEELNADIGDYSAEIQLETADLRLWKINLYVTDTELSKEAEEE